MNPNNTSQGCSSAWLATMTNVYGRNRNGLIWPLPFTFCPHSLFRGSLFLHQLGSEMKPPHSCLFTSNCDCFCFTAHANETGLSSCGMVKQPGLMFLCGTEIWMFTVGWGLITFLQQLKSIGPLMGPIKQ